MEIENHVCFKCNVPFQVIVSKEKYEGPDSCPKCGFFKCPHCESCKCSLGEEAQKAVEAFYQTFCEGSCGKRKRK